jgi:hypothetical protein
MLSDRQCHRSRSGCLWSDVGRRESSVVNPGNPSIARERSNYLACPCARFRPSVQRFGRADGPVMTKSAPIRVDWRLAHRRVGRTVLTARLGGTSPRGCGQVGLGVADGPGTFPGGADGSNSAAPSHSAGTALHRDPGSLRIPHSGGSRRVLGTVATRTEARSSVREGTVHEDCKGPCHEPPSAEA